MKYFYSKPYWKLQNFWCDTWTISNDCVIVCLGLVLFSVWQSFVVNACNTSNGCSFSRLYLDLFFIQTTGNCIVNPSATWSVAAVSEKTWLYICPAAIVLLLHILDVHVNIANKSTCKTFQVTKQYVFIVIEYTQMYSILHSRRIVFFCCCFFSIANGFMILSRTIDVLIHRSYHFQCALNIATNFLVWRKSFGTHTS